MDDLTLTRLCAEAMGYRLDRDGGYSRLCQGAGMDEPDWFEFIYNPLHDDAQAMALVKKFQLSITVGDKWWATPPEGQDASSDDLNRAIVESVAKMRKAELVESMKAASDG